MWYRLIAFKQQLALEIRFIASKESIDRSVQDYGRFGRSASCPASGQVSEAAHSCSRRRRATSSRRPALRDHRCARTENRHTSSAPAHHKRAILYLFGFELRYVVGKLLLRRALSVFHSEEMLRVLRGKTPARLELDLKGYGTQSYVIDLQYPQSTVSPFTEHAVRQVKIQITQFQYVLATDLSG